jgi:hypothetical protein
MAATRDMVDGTGKFYLERMCQGKEPYASLLQDWKICSFSDVKLREDQCTGLQKHFDRNLKAEVFRHQTDAQFLHGGYHGAT